MIETLLSWFDMAGGKWLYATSPADLAERLLAPMGMQSMRRHTCSDQDLVVVRRLAPDTLPDPLSTATGSLQVRDVSRANWPTMAILLYNRAGADPRVSLDESAVTAETVALELIAQQEREACNLKAAFHGARLIGLASIALEPTGERTYAALMPHDDTPAALREALILLARAHGYQQVDFPMEALAEELTEPHPIPTPPASTSTD